MCCTGRRHAEKNKRKVGKEARREKWAAAHLGVAGKGKRRGMTASGREREIKRDMESRQIQSKIRSGRESERPERVFPFVFLSDPKMCSHKKNASFEKEQLRQQEKRF